MNSARRRALAEGLMAVLAVLLVAGLELISGFQVVVSGFFLLPIVGLTHRQGLRPGLALSAFVFVTWLATDVLSVPPEWSRAILVFNALVRLSVNVTVVFLVARLDDARAAAARLADTDALTGLPNRRGFLQALSHEVDRQRRADLPLTLAYLDLDGFKALNDRRGHEQGDQVLRTVGEVLRTALRKHDLVARLGGDEFAVALCDTPAQQAAAVLTRLHAELASQLERCDPDLGVSMGAVTFERLATSVDAMFAQADEVMYGVKRTGKRRLEVLIAPLSPGEPGPPGGPDLLPPASG